MAGVGLTDILILRCASGRGLPATPEVIPWRLHPSLAWKFTSNC